MDDFLAAADPRQRARIIIDGQGVVVARRRLFAHLQLSELELKIKNTVSPVMLSAHILEYLSLAGLTDEQLRSASAYELVEAFFALVVLNSWQWLLPWLSHSTDAPGPEPEPEYYDYSGRRWAVWVHKLASRYGWSRDEIWALWPEEAAAYIQEIMLSEYYEREDRRALSEVSYKYDEVSKLSRFTPTPAYGWMIDESLPDVIRTPRRALPVGNVITVEGE